MRDGEATRLSDVMVEDKETRPPPRYNEGTLIDAMQNAWRFVDNEVLRERLKEARGIGTPATPSRDHRRAKEAGFSDHPRQEHRPHRDGRVAVRSSQTGRSGAGRSGRNGATRMPARRGPNRQAGDGRRDRRGVRCRSTHHRQAQGRHFWPRTAVARRCSEPALRCCSGSYPPRCTSSKCPWAEIVSAASNRAPAKEIGAGSHSRVVIDMAKLTRRLE